MSFLLTKRERRQIRIQNIHDLANQDQQTEEDQEE